MEIAASVRGTVNFNSERAETEFLRHPKWNQKYQKDIRGKFPVYIWLYIASHVLLLTSFSSAVLDNAATFQLAYRWNWRAWEVNVRCDDWLNVCIKGCMPSDVIAYTNNPGNEVKNPNFKSPTMNTINFCKLNFFTKTPTCKKSMKDWGSARNTNPKEGLINYQCQGIKNFYFLLGKMYLMVDLGHTVLHELFHLDSLSKVATTGHITDRKIRYKDYKDYKNDTGYRRAYGPEDVKLLASWANSEVGKYMVTNGTSFMELLS